MKPKHSISIAFCAAITFAAWELLGHRYMMSMPMAAWHVLSAVMGTILALVLVVAVTHAILSQYRHIAELARMRDYLFRMEAHYLRLPPSRMGDPQMHFETQEHNERFSDIQKRFAARSPVVRAKAAIELGEMAIEELPGGYGSYPYFARASAHLGAGLYLEREDEVRAEIMRSIEAMIKFARANKADMLRIIFDDLVHANRTALSGFEIALATYLACLGEFKYETFQSLSRIARIDEDEDVCMKLLEQLALREQCRVEISRQKDMAHSPDSSVEHGHAVHRRQLEELASSAESLVDTRDALCGVLRQLPPPQDLPKQPGELRLWRPEHELLLEGCFLTSAALENAHLEGAHFERSWLQRARMAGIHLARANLNDCRLEEAHLNSAELDFACLERASLQEAGLSSARLQGANLSKAHLEGAYLIGAELTDAVLWKVSVESTSNDKMLRANFKNANWWDARMTDPISGDVDKGIQSWLETLYKKPGANDPHAVAHPGAEAKSTNHYV